MLKKLRKEMDRAGYVRRNSGEPCAHSLNSDLYAARFSTAMPVVLAGEVRQSKRRRRAAVDGEDFVSGTLCEAICLGAWEPALAVTGCSTPLPSCILSSDP